MKNLIKFLFSILMVAGLTTATFSQECKKYKEGEEIKIEKVKKRRSKDYKDWQKIELNSFSFYAPKELKGGAEKCIEGGCYDFESNDLSLSIDINPDAGHATFEKEYQSYCEIFTRIDKANAWIWYFEQDKKYKYNAGVNFTFKNGGDYKIGMYLFSKSENIREISEKIFRSVKFKERPKR